MPWKISANAELDRITRPASSTTATGTGIRTNKLLINCVESIASPVPSLVIIAPSWACLDGRILLRGHLLCNKKVLFFREFPSVFFANFSELTDRHHRTLCTFL